MRFISILRLSWKNLWSHKLRAIITTGGVSIGVAAIIFLVSIGFGLENLVKNQVADFNAFSIIDVPSANLKTERINDNSIKKISQVGHVKSINEIVDMGGRIKLPTIDSTNETVIYAINKDYFKLSDLNLKSGKLFNDGDTNSIVINTSLAKLLGFTDFSKDVIGKNIDMDIIITKDLRAADLNESPIVKNLVNLKIVGVTEDSENPIAYIPLLLATKNGVINRTSLKIKIDTNNRDQISLTRKAIENLGFSTEYVGDTVDQITSVFSLFRIILFGFGAIALIVAILGTFNTLTISLMERIREVGLLKTLGMKKIAIFWLFIAESISIGVLGGFMGIIIGIIGGKLLNLVLRTLATNAGAEPVSIFYAPTNLIIAMFIGSFIVGFITGFYPAIRAIRTSPLNALRYE